MNTQHEPTGIAPPIGAYSHGIEVPAGARTLHVAGQVGLRPDGSLAGPTLAEQGEQIFRNILAILAAAGMTAGDLVRTTHYLVGPVEPDALAAYRDARTRVLGDARPTSTLLFVAGLAQPEFVVEVDAVAARA